MTECIEAGAGRAVRRGRRPDSGVALAAVGSLARRELGPRSDIDLVLLHDGKDRSRIDALAEALWYPLWDSSVRLDHSVRTPAECADVAGRELSAGVGLLDLRVLAGDTRAGPRGADGPADRLARQRPQAAAGAARRPGGTARVVRRRRLPAGARSEGGPRRLPRHDHAAGAGRHLADRPAALRRQGPVRAAARRPRRPPPQLRSDDGPAAGHRGRRRRHAAWSTPTPTTCVVRSAWRPAGSATRST